MSYLWIRVNLAVSITLVMLTAALGKSLSKVSHAVYLPVTFIYFDLPEFALTHTS